MKGEFMPRYILLSTLTPEGRQTMHKNPDRLNEVNKEVDAFGCKIIAQYAVLGGFDFVSIVEAPITRRSLICRWI
ncbi:MAG TPA: GYD domain-containing protein [Candidatus Binatia bacterium]|nr:GYD domain-containing protein [Candidatus Binatia bacterium]